MVIAQRGYLKYDQSKSVNVPLLGGNRVLETETGGGGKQFWDHERRCAAFQREA